MLAQGLFFQYPARTEEAFYRMQAPHSAHLPVPWATIIDKKVNPQHLTQLLMQILARSGYSPRYTACQHIHWKKLVPLFKMLGINTVYTPHKLHGEDVYQGIRVKQIPLFAVNAEDLKFSMGFCPAETRDLLYSFVGAYMPHYITDVRKRIFEMDHPSDAVVENIGTWHLNKVVYSPAQNSAGTIVSDQERDSRTLKYNQVLHRSKFSLCPSGAGPNSIRFWESLAAGSIPVLLSDAMCLPEDDWSCIVCLKEADLKNLHEVLRSITEEQVVHMSQGCVEMYRKHGLRLG